MLRVVIYLHICCVLNCTCVFVSERMNERCAYSASYRQTGTVIRAFSFHAIFIQTTFLLSIRFRFVRASVYIDVVAANVHCNKSGDIFVTPNVQTQATHIQKKIHLLISYLLILFFFFNFVFFMIIFVQFLDLFRSVFISRSNSLVDLTKLTETRGKKIKKERKTNRKQSAKQIFAINPANEFNWFGLVLLGWSTFTPG